MTNSLQNFDKFLREKNLIMNQGVIIDGSFVEVPRQRNTREANKAIKEGRSEELWTSADEKHKRSHKDTECPMDEKGRPEVLRHGMFSRVVGLARNAARNTLTNLVYNVCRYEQIVRLGMN